MIFNLLESTNNSTAKSGLDGWIWFIILIPLVLLMVFNYFSNKKRREQNEKEMEKRNAIQPGFKVTTIGGILGTVVEVNNEENWFILETGSEDNLCYLKFDKVAIYNSEDPNAQNNEEVVDDDILAEEEVAEEVETADEVAEVNDEEQSASDEEEVKD